mgnify:FL=1
MAILIMAVGIVSVFTLFPISVLRTIQATQQTNSKILKLNATEIVKTSPVVLTAFEAGVLRYRGPWQPNVNLANQYLDNDVVVPSLKAGDLFPTPLVFYRATILNGSGLSGATEPEWFRTQSVTESDGTNQIQWDPILNASGDPISYVVDPLGWNIANLDGTTPRDEFGNKTDTSTGQGGTPPAGGPPLLRIHGSMSDIDVARSNVFLDDNWEEVFSATPESATTTSVRFPAGTDLTGLTGGARRVVLTSTDGSKTIYRLIDGDPIFATFTLNLIAAEPIPNLATSFPQVGGNPDVGLARVEVLNRRFSWFLTVRNSGSEPEIKCVVVFNRDPGSASEHVYDSNYANANIDIDADGTEDSIQHGLGSRNDWVKITWDPATEPEPLLKAGNWLFDARTVSWYRVQQIQAVNDGTAPYWAVLILDKSVRVETPDDGAGPPSNANPPGRTILMPGIIEVFDL